MIPAERGGQGVRLARRKGPRRRDIGRGPALRFLKEVPESRGDFRDLVHSAPLQEAHQKTLAKLTRAALVQDRGENLFLVGNADLGIAQKPAEDGIVDVYLGRAVQVAADRRGLIGRKGHLENRPGVTPGQRSNYAHSSVSGEKPANATMRP